MRSQSEVYEEQVLEKFHKLIMKLSYKTYKNYNGKYALDDIVQEAKIGAIKAVRNFDPSKNVKIITHLHNYINFYLSHFTRDDTGLIKIPKTTKVEKDKLPEIIDTEVFQSNYVNERCPVFFEIEHDVENKLFVENCLNSLSERERMIVELIFIQGYTYNQVAELHNFSRQYANAVVAKALNKLKNKFCEYANVQ